jgi:tetratricopeptide (TPR) repeat protein
VKPSDPLGYQILAGYYNRQGEFEKTIDAFQKRANMEPNNPEAWHTMGSFYFDKVSRDKALDKKVGLSYTMKGLEAEDKALALNAEYFEALSFKNLLLPRAGELREGPRAAEGPHRRGRSAPREGHRASGQAERLGRSRRRREESRRQVEVGSSKTEARSGHFWLLSSNF